VLDTRYLYRNKLFSCLYELKPLCDNARMLWSVKLKPINKQVRAMRRRATTGTLKMDVNYRGKIYGMHRGERQSPCNYWTNYTVLLPSASTETVSSNCHRPSHLRSCSFITFPPNISYRLRCIIWWKEKVLNSGKHYQQIQCPFYPWAEDLSQLRLRYLNYTNTTQTHVYKKNPNKCTDF
jgi:hypothetical protein